MIGEEECKEKPAGERHAPSFSIADGTGLTGKVLVNLQERNL